MHKAQKNEIRKRVLSTFRIQIVILSIRESAATRSLSAAFLITGRGETGVEYEVGMISYRAINSHFIEIFTHLQEENRHPSPRLLYRPLSIL